MGQAEVDDRRVLEFSLDRRLVDSPNLAGLLSDIASSIGELERKNRQLEQERSRLEARNAELQRALQDADERAADLQRAASTDTESTRRALSIAAQMLASAQTSVGSARTAAKAESAARYEEAISRALELQKEAASLLQSAQDEAALRYQDAERKSSETLVGACKSIQAMAEQLDTSFSGQCPTSPPRHPAGQRGLNEEETVIDAGIRPPIVSHRAEVQRIGEVIPFAGNEVAWTAAATPREEGDLYSLTTSIELVASPFGSFAELSRFHRAVGQLKGVVEVRAVGFERGSLRLAVEYSSLTPLVGSLMELSHFSLHLVSVNDDRIEVRIVGTGA